MRKNYVGIVLIMALLLGCGNKNEYKPQLPENYQEVETEAFESEEAEEDCCASFVINGRKYLYYSSMNRWLNESDVHACLGRIVTDEDDSDEYIVSLNESEDNDYLVVYVDEPHFMMPCPDVYRAEDTRFQDIEAPSFVEKLKEGEPMYQFWKGL